MIRALLLDLDDTLLDDRAASRAAFEGFAAAYPLPAGGQSLEERYQRWRALSGVHWRRFEAGEIDFREQRRARVRDYLGTGLCDPEADAAYEPYRLAYEAAWRWLPGVDRFLAGTLDLPRVLLTNGDRAAQNRKVDACGLRAEFVEVLTPADAGAWKPDRRIFEAGLAALRRVLPDLEPGEVLMIGDDAARDIEPARALGMAVWSVAPGSSPADALVRLSNPAAVVQRQLEAFHRRDLEAWLDTYADGAVQYAFPAEELARGRTAVAARMTGRFADDPAQAAVLKHRSVAGSVVCDHERVTRTLNGRVVAYDLLAVYQVAEGRIVSAVFAPGPVDF